MVVPPEACPGVTFCPWWGKLSRLGTVWRTQRPATLRQGVSLFAATTVRLSLSASPPMRKPSSTSLIFLGLALGIVVGGLLPEDVHPVAYEGMAFLAKAFIGLIKGLIVPLLFATIVVGIAQTGDLKAVGRMGGKALLYFEGVTSLALVIGLVVVNTLRPGDNLPLDLGVHAGVPVPKTQSGWDIALHALPTNLVKHAAEGDILPVVVFATLFGVALMRTGEKGKPVLAFFEGVAQTMFKYTDIVMRVTPLGVFGAMGYNVSHMASGLAVGGGAVLKGWEAVLHLLRQYAVLVGSLYFALALLFALVFLPILLLTRTPVRAFVRAVRDPVLTAFSTASSEAALPRLLEQLVAFGVPRRVASFVVPAGYSFNLDGSTLYLVLASITIAQAAHVDAPLLRRAIDDDAHAHADVERRRGRPAGDARHHCGHMRQLPAPERGGHCDAPRRRQRDGHGSLGGQRDGECDRVGGHREVGRVFRERI